MKAPTKKWLVCWCGAAARQYMNGPACPNHSPAALAGREETVPDPHLTLAGFLALDEADQGRVRREAGRMAQQVRRGGRPRLTASRKHGKPGERFYTADDVDMARVHAAEARVGRVLEQRLQERLAARDGGR